MKQKNDERGCFLPELEKWRPIKEFEDYYEVSQYGRIKSKARIIPHKWNGTYKYEERLLSPALSAGYLSVSLYKKCVCKPFKIHILVWDHFGDTPRKGHQIQVDHTFNNRMDNLIYSLQLLSDYDNAIKEYPFKKKVSGLPLGVYQDRAKYRTRININGKRIGLGSYLTIGEAKRVYDKAQSEHRETKLRGNNNARA